MDRRLRRIRLWLSIVSLLFLAGSLFALVKSLMFSGNAQGRVTSVDGAHVTVTTTYQGRESDTYPSGIQKWGLNLGDRVNVDCWFDDAGYSGDAHRAPYCSPETTPIGFAVLSGAAVVIGLLCVVLWWPLLMRFTRRARTGQAQPTGQGAINL